MKPKGARTRTGKPRATLVGSPPTGASERVQGKGKGRFRTKKGFDDPLPDDLLALFEGSR